MRAEVERNIEFRTDVARFEGEENDLLDMLSMSEQRTYLVSILNRQDKMSMGAGVEARVPFIDYRIVEFANRLQSRAKTRGIGTKQIVKRVAEKYLPKDVVHRRKSGFGVPLKQWFMANQPLGNLAAELFSTSDDSEFINVCVLEELLIAHQKDHSDYSEMLWTAVNFLKWKSVYGL
jgi:asparagine synthase (glutamine-hydrolysing)